MRRLVIPTAIVVVFLSGCALLSPLTTEEQQIVAALPQQIEEQGGFIDELQSKLTQTTYVLQNELEIAKANLTVAASEAEKLQILTQIQNLQDKLTDSEDYFNEKIDSAQTKYAALDSLLTKLRDKEATGADWAGATLPFIPDGPWKLPLVIIASLIAGKTQERTVGNKKLKGVVNSITQGTTMNGDGTGTIDMGLVGKFQDASGVRTAVRKARTT